MTAFDRANVKELATGTLTTYDSQIDNTTGTIKMRATFDNPNGVLFPQQFVNVRLLVDTLTGVALAPNAAVQLGPSGNFVYLLNDDLTVSKRDVVTGPANGKVTTIAKGLAVGDKVVIDGVDRLRDGAKVTLAEERPRRHPTGSGRTRQGQRHSSGGGAGAGGTRRAIATAVAGGGAPGGAVRRGARSSRACSMSVRGPEARSVEPVPSFSSTGRSRPAS